MPMVHRRLAHIRRNSHTSHVALHYLAPFLLSVYPLALVIGGNVGVVPLDPVLLFRLAAGGAACTTALLLLLRPLISQPAARGMWLSTFYAGCNTYGFVLLAFGSTALDAGPLHPVFAVSFLLLSATIATVAVAPSRQKDRDPVPWLVVALVLVGVAALKTPSGIAAAASRDWLPAARAMTESGTVANPAASRATRPDIFYIVLDGFGRPDVLAERYDLDLSDFVSSLQSRGFYVADRARSNYAQTYLSLASTLNASYLDPIVASVGPASESRLPLDLLIRQGAVFTAARRSGYRVVGVGSDYMATRRFDNVDVCICDPQGLDEISLAVLLKTPLAGLGVARWNYEPHRRLILDAFETVGSTPRLAQPQFVFAHIVAPHPPFVFRADGAARDNRHAFGFDDALRFPGSPEEYLAGYRDQAQFIASRVVSMIDRLLDRPGPEPVVVIHADHGPGLKLDWARPDAAGIRERMSILAAYRAPAGQLDAYPTVTPVSMARMVSEQYFGLPRQARIDASWFSSWARPYDFSRVAGPDEPEPPPGR